MSDLLSFINMGMGGLGDFAGFIMQMLGLIPDMFNLVITMFGIFTPILIWVFLHFDISILLLEIFFIGLAFMLTQTNSETAGNPISIISNWFELHFKALSYGFMFMQAVFNLIANGIIALTTWIP